MPVSLDLTSDDAFKSEKFKQVLHYIISRTDSSRHQNVGKKVLYKLLYFNDFNYYERTEIKMTGEIYSKLEHGPAPRHFHDMIDELKKSGQVKETRVKYYEHEQIRFCSLQEPDLSLLSATEIQHIDDTLGRYASMNGSQIEATSHKDLPWIASEDKENLDYDLVFYRSADMSVRNYCSDD